MYYAEIPKYVKYFTGNKEKSIFINILQVLSKICKITKAHTFETSCEKCLNFDNILKQAAQYLSGIPEELNKAIDVSMCKYEGYFLNIDYVTCKCTDCNLDGFKDKLFEANASKLNDQRKYFLVKEWITKTKENIGATQSYLHWKVHHCSYSDLIGMYVKHIAHMSEHTFLQVGIMCSSINARIIYK